MNNNPDLKKIPHIQDILAVGLNAAANGIIITDPEGIIVYINPAVTRLTGYDADELVGKKTNVFSSGKHSVQFYQDLWGVISSGNVWRGDIINRRKDGREYMEDMTITPVFDEEGEIQNYIAIKQDITQYRKAVDALEASEERFRQLVNSVEEHFYIAESMPNGELMCTYITQDIVSLTGYPSDKFLTDWSFWQGLVHPDDLNRYKTKEKEIRMGIPKEAEYRIISRDGKVKWVDENVQVKKDEHGKLAVYATITDVTARRESEKRIRFLATHDSLTNLPNRIMFMEILEHAISYARRNQDRVAVFFLDVDNFKVINDTYGHHIGDELLKAIAERLTNHLREHDTVSRISGDEFTLITEQLTNVSSAERLARKISNILERTYRIEKYEIEVSVSVGGSVFPDHADSHEALIRLADQAMYTAKNSAEIHYCIYQPE